MKKQQEQETNLLTISLRGISKILNYQKTQVTDINVCKQ